MKRFRAKFNPKRKGVYAVSLVDEPAMEGDFIQFSKKEDVVEFAVIDEGSHRIMGLILEPNKNILRYDAVNKEPYEVFFTEQDVKDVAYNFQKQGHQNNSTKQHDGRLIKDVSFVETWIVENPKVDKSTNYGFEYPKGSWVGVMEVKNKEIVNDIKLGRYKGFSIDAIMEFEQVNLKKVNMSEIKEDSILDAIKKGFAQLAENPFAKKKDEKDMTPEEIEKAKKLAEKLKAEKDGKKKEDEEEKVKMAKIEADKLALEAVKEAAKIEFNSEDFIKSMISELKTILEPTEVALAKLEKDVLEFKAENETLKSENLELSKLPATKSIGRVHLNKNTKETSYQRFRRHNKQFN